MQISNFSLQMSTITAKIKDIIDAIEALDREPGKNIHNEIVSSANDAIGRPLASQQLLDARKARRKKPYRFHCRQVLVAANRLTPQEFR